MQEQKTDLMKYKELLDSFGIVYAEEVVNGNPSSTLVYLAESYDCAAISNFVNVPKNHKVSAYSGFYCYFAFDDQGKFEQVGIYE